ncbi:TetR/AcrR family transcriptional regulator [Alkalimonas delamerensis]|uniref:TetR/AcrR family transcriptional regulator n=1 Tax=Alkalimonas delamerensis TaxID=265981 RepID=A0ABT9GTJ9_9GAMM|nr:TetR/AcrR family transcriptional regulator [Alkalimonas delamerensis]MDP4530297.1 TetR/AcrR family transcriptional regulator [Alkalimonas delamerensis]
MPPQDKDSKDRILDAAEELFARHGFDGVTLRQIASLAGVDVALTNYHFGKKQALLSAVVARRGALLNAARLDALRFAEQVASPKPAAIEQIVEAFLQPLKIAQASTDKGWKHYCALIAYINNSPVWGKTMMEQHFDDLIREFTSAMQRTFPKACPEKIFWCYHQLSGALALTFANTGRIDSLSGGLCHSDDFEAAYQVMVPFISAGFRQLCSDQGA